MQLNAACSIILNSIGFVCFVCNTWHLFNRTELPSTHYYYVGNDNRLIIDQNSLVSKDCVVDAA